MPCIVALNNKPYHLAVPTSNISVCIRPPHLAVKILCPPRQRTPFDAGDHPTQLAQLCSYVQSVLHTISWNFQTKPCPLFLHLLPHFYAAIHNIRDVPRLLFFLL